MVEKDDVPLLPTVGILYNIKHPGTDEVRDAQAEYDSMDTVLAIRRALESGGYRTVLLEEDRELPQKLAETPVDIVFNIAEGLRGRGREAEAPGLLNLLGIPFTGSDETALGVALDKALSKRLAAALGVPTPAFAVTADPADPALDALPLPVIVKPNAEGSSKGIPDACVASDREELHALVRRNLKLYGGEMLAEEYVSGREFTVGILGNGPQTRVFPPMEILFRRDTHGSYRVYSFDVKQNYKQFVDYRCPAELTAEQDARMRDLALSMYRALGCRDFARVDFRMDGAGRMFFIEINPLPGLAPGYSDYPMLAEMCGVPYDELVLSVLRAALERLPEVTRK